MSLPQRHPVNTSSKVLYILGMDRIVRLWNPYVPQKPTAFLRGHSSPIAFLAIAGDDKRLFSISIDKCVKVCIGIDGIDLYSIVSLFAYKGTP